MKINNGHEKDFCDQSTSQYNSSHKDIVISPWELQKKGAGGKEYTSSLPCSLHFWCTYTVNSTFKGMSYVQQIISKEIIC